MGDADAQLEDPEGRQQWLADREDPGGGALLDQPADRLLVAAAQFTDARAGRLDEAAHVAIDDPGFPRVSRVPAGVDLGGGAEALGDVAGASDSGLVVGSDGVHRRLDDLREQVLL